MHTTGNTDLNTNVQLDVDRRKEFDDYYWKQGTYTPDPNNTLSKQELRRRSAVESRRAYAQVKVSEGPYNSVLVYEYTFPHACARGVEVHNEIVMKQKMLRDPHNFDPDEVSKL